MRQQVRQTVRWFSPLFGGLEGVALEQFESYAWLEHPLTGERIRIPRSWIVRGVQTSAAAPGGGLNL